MTDGYITLRNVTRTYPRSEGHLAALEGLSLSVDEGAFAGIVGHSGAGKSTLLNIVGGLDRPTSGSVTVGGTDVGALDETALARYRRETVGFVFQQANLVPALTVFENVMLPLVPLAGAEPDKVQRVDEVLAEVNIDHRRDHLPGELSGGEQQRAAVARAVVNDPQLILADEPTGELDSENAARILGLLKRLNDQGRTVIIASHDADTIAVTERILRLREGMLVDESTHSDEPTAKAAPGGTEGP